MNLGNDTAICSGGSLTLNAGNPGASYLWNPGGATTQQLTINTTDTYRVAVTNSFGCTGRDTINVTLGSNPVVNLGSDTSVCGNVASLVLNAGNPGSSYIWTPGGSTSQTFNVAPLINNIDVNGASYTNTGYAYTFSPVSDSFASAYTWSFGDNTGVSLAHNATHTYTANGTYTVRLIVDNDCGKDTVVRTVTIQGLSAGSTALSADMVKVYPNPASGQVSVELNGDLDLQEVTLYNTVGSVIMRQQVSGSRHSFSVDALANGTYQLNVRTSNGTVIRRIEVLR